MAFHATYETKTIRPVAGQDGPDAVEVDIAPAWGADIARIKSVMVSCLGLTGEDWSPEAQAAVIASFDTSAKAFESTILAIRHFTVPAAMALRAGLLAPDRVPTRIVNGSVQPDLQAPVAVSDGKAYAKVAGAFLGISLSIAMEIATLSAEVQVDERFFAQPSGSSGAAMSDQKGTSAPAARSPNVASATAVNGSTNAAPSIPAGGTAPATSGRARSRRRA